MNNGILILNLTLLLLLSSLFSQGCNDINVVQESFDNNPRWENLNNRVNCTDCPEIKQDFGWNPTNNNGSGVGEIGGTIWRSTTPSYYAMPLGEALDFKDEFSASGKISIVSPEKEGFGFYFGFFNAERQGWRVWSSCGVRIGERDHPIKQEPSGLYRFHADYKTGEACGAILNPDLAITGDGSVHTWEIKYEPDVRVSDSKWLDPRVEKYFPQGGSNIHTDKILMNMQKDVPSMTKDRLLEILFDARDKGIIDDWYRKDRYHLWDLEKEPEKIKGKITFTFDGESASYFLIPGHQDIPTLINRFGIWNMQIYTGSLEFYMSDLVVNKRKIDLSQDPHWQGLNNRMNMIERDFHARHNYGYSQTNWAGKNIGEIGGRFWGTEVEDPLYSYYAVDVGKLTLEDPIRFSGSINFVEGFVDGRMLFGYFNKNEYIKKIDGEYKGDPPPQFLGIEVLDQTRYGYNFSAVCSPQKDIATALRGPIYIPDRIRRLFTFDYDPNKGDEGRITIKLGENTFEVDLTAEQRKVGSTFDHFGLLNPRKGGKSVDVYIDDIEYYTRKLNTKYVDQKETKVSYPEWGRKY